MEFIKVWSKKKIAQICIYILIFFVTFLFADIIIILANELKSIISVFIILLTMLYMYMIVITMLKLQVVMDKNVWKNLFRLGLLNEEKHKITAVMDAMFMVTGLILGIIVSNIVIYKYQLISGNLLVGSLMCIYVELVVCALANFHQNYFISVLYDNSQHESKIRIHEKAPLFLKNILRSKEKMGFMTAIICIGIIICNSLIFYVDCDDRDLFIEKAISVDYFLSEYDTWYGSYRTEDQVVDEKDIKHVMNNPYFLEGGRIYHSLDGDRVSLITDKLPEQSQYDFYLGLPFETNEQGNYLVNLHGADQFVFSIMEMYEGEIDYEKLATGDYIIYGLQRHEGIPVYSGDVSEQWKYYEVGDKITLEGNGKKKEYEIMAICVVSNTYEDTDSYIYNGRELVFYLPTEEYLSYGHDEPMRYIFNTKNGKNIDDDLKGISFESKREWITRLNNDDETIKNIAIIFAFGCVGTGIFIYINVVVMLYIDRKNEFEILENIGMSSRKLKRMIVAEGLYYGLRIAVISSLISLSIEYIVGRIIDHSKWIFQYIYQPLIICNLIVIIISVTVPLIVFKRITK